jgi:very-short-patch-repair endonuclease
MRQTSIKTMQVNCFVCNKEMVILGGAKIRVFLQFQKAYCSIACKRKKIEMFRKVYKANCKICQKEVSFVTKAEKNRYRTGVHYCSKECFKIKRRKDMDVLRAMVDKEKMSKRMRENNPMSNMETRQKMINSLRGRTFLSRGGNGEYTKHQMMLHLATGYPMEHPINTSEVKHLFQSVPNSYKVDLAEPSIKLAIEVDGKTHRLKKWKFLDKRKTEILNSLGWTVIRFTNEEVETSLSKCVKKIMSTTLKLKETTTTL